MTIQISPASTTPHIVASNFEADAGEAPLQLDQTADTHASGGAQPWTRLPTAYGLHRDVQKFANAPARGSSSDNASSTALLHSYQTGPAQGNATAVAPRPVTPDEMGKIYGVLAGSGTIGDLREGNLMQPDRVLHQWLSAGVKFEVRSASDSYFDAKTKTMVFGANTSAAERARAMVFEARKMSIEEHHQAIKERLGQRDYDNANYRTDGHADPALKTRYEPKTREEFAAEKASIVANAASDAIEFNLAQRAAGRASTPAPLEDVYTQAYKHASGDREAAGRAAVEKAVKDGKLTTADTHEPYRQVFDRQWDALQVAKAKEQAQLAKAQAAAKLEGERDAKITAGAKALAELVNAVDPKSPQAAQVIELVQAFAAQNPGAHATLFTFDARDGLERLLGPFGFKSIDDVGNYKMEQARLDYALSNFQRLTPQQRTGVLQHPEYGAKYGISHFRTVEETQAREQEFVNKKLPDGSNFQGTRAAYREASQRVYINHALAQLEQIRHAGPTSLAGRIVGGEKGAAIGAMFDGFLVPLAQTGQAKIDMQNTVNSNRPDPRPAIANSRTAPARSSASETQPNRPGGPPAPPTPPTPPTGRGAAGGGGHGSDDAGFRAGVSSIGGPDRIAGHPPAPHVAPGGPPGRQRGDSMKQSTSSRDVQEQAEAIQRAKTRSDTYQPTGDEDNDKPPPIIERTTKSEDNFRNRTREIRSGSDVDPDDWE